MTKIIMKRTASSQMVPNQSTILNHHRDGIQSKWLYIGDSGGKNSTMKFKRLYQPDVTTDPSVPFDDQSTLYLQRTVFNKFIANMNTFKVTY